MVFLIFLTTFFSFMIKRVLLQIQEIELSDYIFPIVDDKSFLLK